MPIGLRKPLCFLHHLTLLSQSGESQLLELLIIFALRLAGVRMSPANLIYYRAFGGKPDTPAAIPNIAAGADISPEFHGIYLIAG